MSPTNFISSSNFSQNDISQKIEKMRSLLYVENLVHEPWFLTDEYLLWWLEDKKMNVRKAVKKYRQTMIWRQENKVDKISYNENWINTIFQFVGLNHEGGPIFMNRPVVEERVGESFLDEDKASMERLLIFQLEKILATFKKLGTYKPATLIVDGNQCWMAGDLNGLNFQSILVYPQLKATATLFTLGYELLKTKYPGMVGEVFMINTPGVLRRAFSYISKPYIRADFLAKIKTYGGNRDKWVKEMRKIMKEDDIDELLPPEAKPRYHD